MRLCSWQRDRAVSVNMSPDDDTSGRGGVEAILGLPAEVLLHVFSFLDQRDLARARRACTSFNIIASDHRLRINLST